MTITARGLISIGGVQLTTDPETYEAFNWPKRWSKHPGIAGATVIQDFGRFARDLVLRLVSGRSQFLHEDVVKAIQTAHGTKGALYALTDWMGNEFDVYIADFTPVPSGLPELYTYTLELHVWTITKLFGTSYGGS